MASKQLGKFRQWAGEKISYRDRTVSVGDDLRELEQDIDLRKQGIIRLQAVSEDYHHVLSKKKEFPSSGETEKLMPLDALGIVMVTHGEEYGDESAFGSCLVSLGRAHCRIATIQEAYGLTFKDTFITSCERFAQDIKDYEHQRKKLDSRRLSYDAAITKLDKIKNGKKEREKERREAEDELQRCRLHFEETSEDVRSRMQIIQENEILQLRQLTNFLDIQLNYVRQYYDTLNEVKSGWCDELTLAKFEDMRVNQSQAFSSADDSTIRSKHSITSSRTSSSGESVDNPGVRTPVRPKPDAEKPATPSLSRSTSRSSRKRSDSGITIENGSRHGKKMSVSGWASSAVSTITGLGKKDRDTFTALMNEDEEKDVADSPVVSRPPSSRSFSRKSPKVKSVDLPIDSQKTNGRILKPPSQQEKKLVRALYDFSGSSDELSFKAGDEITVLNEVLDDWWLGMHKDGRKGLFPVTYTECVSKIRHSSPFESELIHVTREGESELIPDYLNPPLSASSLAFDTKSVSSTIPDDEEERHLIPLKPSDEDDLPAPCRDIPFVPPPILWNRTNSDVPKKTRPPPPPRRPTVTGPSPLIPDRRLQTENRTFGPTIKTASNDSSGQDISPFDSLVDISSHCVSFEQHPNEAKGLCKNCFRAH